MRRAWTRRLLALGALVLVLFVAGATAAEPRVLVLAELDNAPQAEAVTALRSEMRRSAGVDVEVMAPSSADAVTVADARLIVTVGSPAAHAAVALGTDAPLLHILLSRRTLDALPHRPDGAPWSALLLDQPAQRQVALIRLALPEQARIATIASPETTALVDALEAAATHHGLGARSAVVLDTPSLYPALRSVLEQPAVLVTTPDSRVFNSHTVHHVLLTAFRLGAPVLGYSAAYVRAGAVLGLYTTPAQAGMEAAALVQRVLSGGGLPPPGHHALFEVGVNPTVARSLGIQLPHADTLTRALHAQEERRP